MNWMHMSTLIEAFQRRKIERLSQCYKIGKEYVLDATHATLKHASGVNKDFELCARQVCCRCFVRSGETLSAGKAILDKFWNTEVITLLPAALDVFVTKLRKFLSEDESVTIKTVKGVGLILIEN